MNNGARFHELDTTLAAILRANRDRDWFFVKPGGNWGDGLIYAGAESLGRRLGLSWADLDFNTFEVERIPRGAAIYLHGGGGFNPWGSGRAFVNLHRALSIPDALVVQGPQTVESRSEDTTRLFGKALAGAAAQAVHFFARERSSLEYLRKTLPRSIEIHLDHDTAFHLDQGETLRIGGLETPPPGRYTLLVSRKDDEAPLQRPKGGTREVVMDPAYYASSFAHWIRIHAFADLIRTNRLHSAIVGSLLGKPVQLMAGSYHKNRSIWEFSLEGRGVQWCETLPADPRDGHVALPAWLTRSWKVHRALMWLKGVPAK